MILATSIPKNSPASSKTSSTSSSSSDQAYCERLASQLRYEDLPDACHSYRLSSRRPTDPFAGMTAGAAVEARRALSEKRESHAQIQRRMTSLGRR
ncbi:hypothetical protein FisN_7Hh393 [Fistulifera solaris]|uniref:Uncharacterized protein n=1 Tax=Fistulifera solaris TaxID=1519565 RepID=A0A1Z5KRT3_FISSO|nr:hypothetical protein FisN_7Hh393 [Fistulifera solaris]|eukprot:GAX29016.1 hypothetical protein FisN_7Hh393 [Fistulifera solaris]